MQFTNILLKMLFFLMNQMNNLANLNIDLIGHYENQVSQTTTLLSQMSLNDSLTE